MGRGVCEALGKHETFAEADPCLETQEIRRCGSELEMKPESSIDPAVNRKRRCGYPNFGMENDFLISREQRGLLTLLLILNEP